MKKILLSLTGLVIVTVIGGFLYLYFNLNSLIKEGVEEYAPQYTKTDVTLGGASVSFLSGEGGLSNLAIGNPKGYKSAEALSLGELGVAIDIDTVTDDVIVIHSIDVVAPAISYEYGGNAGSNLQQLVKNIQSSAKSAKDSGKTPAKETGKEKKVIIDRLTIRDGRVSILTPLSDEALLADLPTIEMTQIGRKTGGEHVSEVVKQVMKRVTNAASKVANVSLDDLKANMKGKIKDKVQDAINDKVPANLQEQLGGDKLKGLFGN